MQEGRARATQAAPCCRCIRRRSGVVQRTFPRLSGMGSGQYWGGGPPEKELRVAFAVQRMSLGVIPDIFEPKISDRIFQDTEDVLHAAWGRHALDMSRGICSKGSVLGRARGWPLPDYKFAAGSSESPPAMGPQGALSAATIVPTL